jgi:hypothetical protein
MNAVVKTLSTAFAIQASVPTVAAVQCPDTANATPETGHFQARGDAATTPKDELAAVTGAVDSNNQMEFRMAVESPPKWSKRIAQRYLQLVEEEAIGRLTNAEEAELEMLQRLRRRDLNPPTAEEVFHQYRQKKLDTGMIELVRRYVRFHVPESNKKALAT